MVCCGQRAAAAVSAADVSAFPAPSQGGKWGYLKETATGEIIFEPRFSNEGSRPGLDVSIVPAPNAEGMWGYVDAITGKVLIAPRFYGADFFYDGIAIVSRSYPDMAHGVMVLNREGKVKPATVVPVAEGLIDRNGRDILPARYDIISVNSNGTHIPRLFLLKNAQGATALFHTDKGYIVPPWKYKALSLTSEGGVFCDGGAYYDPGGKRHTPPAGCEITHVESETGLLRVRQKKGAIPLKGVMRRDGSLLVPVKYHEIVAAPVVGVWLASRVDASARSMIKAAVLTKRVPEIDEGADVLTVDVYDATGKVLRSFRARYHPTASGEYCTYQSKGRKYTVNARTWETMPEREEPADPTTGFQPFKEGNKYGIKNANGAVSVQALYDRMHSLGGGLFAATRQYEYYSDNWGVIDGNGREIIPFIYGGIEAASYPTRTTGPLHCMRFSSKEEGYWLMGRNGRFLTPRNKPYGSRFYFNDVGLATVYRDGKHGVIAYSGKEVLPCEYKTVFDELGLRKNRDREEGEQGKTDGNTAETAKLTAKDSLFRVERNELWGVYDGTGKKLIPVQYGFIDMDNPNLEQGWVGVEDKKRQNRGLLNFRTGQTIAPIYSSVNIYPGFFLAYIHATKTDNNREVYIMLDRQGKEGTRYERAKWLKDAGLLMVRTERNGKYALLDGTGRQIYPFRCDAVWEAAASFVWCRTDAGKFLVDNTGREYRIQ